MAIAEKKAGPRSRLYISAAEKYVSMLSEKGIQVVIGHAPATDGKGTIYLPALPEDASEDKRIQWLAYAMHEQAHFHGSSDPSKMPQKKAQHFCINAVDDIRVERMQEETYPGIPDHRRHAYQLDMDEFLGKELSEASASDPGKLVIALLKYMIVKVRVQQMKAPIDVPASPDILEYYKKFLRVFEPRLNTIKTFQQAMDLGTESYALLKDIIKDAQQDQSQDPDQGQGSGSQPDPDEESDEDQDSQGSDSDEEPDEDQDSGSSKSSGEESGEDQDSGSSKSSGSDSDEEPDEDGDPSSSTEPDEDQDSGTGDDDTDAEEAAQEVLDELDDGEGIETVADRYKDAVDALAKAGGYKVLNGIQDDISFNYEAPNAYVERGKVLLGAAGTRMTKFFVSKTRETVDFNQHRGRFDMKAFVSDASDARKDVFNSTRPGSLDKAAVSFAIDNSGSMDGDRIEKAYQILGGLLYYLDRAGIPSEAAGFTAYGSTQEEYRNGRVIIKIVKTFDESFKGKPRLRCHPPVEKRYTIELECLKFLAPRLYRRPEGKRILFVLSDGDPDANNSILTGKLIVAYKEYIQRLRDLGIIVIGFGIDTNVSKYFGTDCINTATNNLGDEIVKKLTEILNRR